MSEENAKLFSEAEGWQILAARLREENEQREQVLQCVHRAHENWKRQAEAEAAKLREAFSAAAADSAHYQQRNGELLAEMRAIVQAKDEAIEGWVFGCEELKARAAAFEKALREINPWMLQDYHGYRKRARDLINAVLAEHPQPQPEQ